MAQDIGCRSGLSHITRRLPAVALLLALVAALLPGITASAGAQATTVAASLQVYLCPTGYTGTAYLDDCTVTGDGDFDVSVTDDLVGGTTTATTNAAGLVNLDLNAGDYTFTLEVPGDFASFYYACFDGDGVFQFDGASNQIAQTFGTGDALSCRWYVIPDDAVGDASAAFQVFVCPVDYTGDDYLADCDTVDPDNLIAPLDVGLVPGAAYDPDLAQVETTGDDGRLGFSGLTAGTYAFGLAVPEENGSFYYACFDVTSGSETFLFDGTDNELTAEIAQSGALSCRWYLIPETFTGPPVVAIESIGVQVYDCPVAYAGDDYLTDCAPTTSPTGVVLSSSVPFDPANAMTAQTGAEGRVSFAGLAADDYSVAVDVPGEFADFYHACFDVTSGSEVFLFSGLTNTADFAFDDQTYSDVSCRFYIIPEDLRGDTSAFPSASASPSASAASARPSASSGPVVTLPSTGTGADGKGGLGSVALPLVAVLMAAIIAAIALAIRRTGLTR